MIKDCELGINVRIPFPDLVNLYSCKIGDNTFIGPFVEIQKNCIVANNCKIESHTFICSYVTIEDDVFIGHGVMFINDMYPRAVIKGRLQSDNDWKAKKTLVKKGASIGSNATILPVRIGYSAMVGAAAVVTTDVRDYALVVGNPAHTMRFLTS